MIKIKKTLYIRNVDAAVIAKIDELAAERGISRNKYVNIILETFAYSDKVKESEEKYTELVTSTINAMNNVTLALNQMKNSLNTEKRKDISINE